jgi:hypothetical protein
VRGADHLLYPREVSLNLSWIHPLASNAQWFYWSGFTVHLAAFERIVIQPPF